MAKVTAFPALSHVTTVSTGSSYTAYTATPTSSNGPPKVPGSPGCISPDSTTMVGPSGFEASLYDEFMSNNKRTYAQQPQQPSVLQQTTQQPQPQTYLLPQTTVLTTSLVKSQPTNEDYTRLFYKSSL